MDFKICSKCKVNLRIAEFNKDCTKKDGYKTICRTCSSKASAVYREQKAKGENKPRPKVPVSQVTAEQKLQSEARVMAIKTLIDNHPVEFRRLVARSLERLGAPKRWKQVG